MKRNNNSKHKKHNHGYKGDNRGDYRGGYRGGYNFQRDINYYLDLDNQKEKSKKNEIKNSKNFTNTCKEIKSFKKTHFSYTQLNQMQSKEDNEIIEFFMGYKNLPEIFENTKFTPDMKSIMTDLLSKISLINSGPSTIILNQILENTEFMKDILRQLDKKNYSDKEYLKLLFNVTQLGNKLIDKITDSKKRIRHKDISENVDMVQYLINDGKMENHLELGLKIVDVFNDFKSKELALMKLEFEKKEKENIIKEKKYDMKNYDDIPIDYKTREIELNKKDFNEKNDIKIAEHIKKGSYKTYDRYINTMFYLEYEDCYRALRAAINDFQEKQVSVNKMTQKELYKL
jgi:hypothetical protein